MKLGMKKTKSQQTTVKIQKIESTLKNYILTDWQNLRKWRFLDSYKLPKVIW